jgi:hypothetical protein
MNFLISVRVTRAKKCREGFYVIFNGTRIRFSNKKDALQAVNAFLALQRLQVVTVREYQRSNLKRITRRISAAVGNSSQRRPVGRAENSTAIPAGSV